MCKPYKNLIDAIATWNTRAAIPIGRCEECLSWVTGDQSSNRCACQVLSSLKYDRDGGAVLTESYDFCSFFEPKEVKKSVRSKWKVHRS